MNVGQKTVLHVGCGTRDPRTLHAMFRLPEWNEIRLDINPSVRPDIIASITAMPMVADESMDAIWSSHNLEHLFSHEVPAALKEFLRVLKPGGFAEITVPDIQKVAESVAAGQLEDALYASPAGPIAAIDMLWGYRPAIASGNSFMAHRTGYTAVTLAKKLLQAGFEKVAVRRDEPAFAIWATAYKAAGPRADSQPAADQATTQRKSKAKRGTE